jgi:hypothetical protein
MTRLDVNAARREALFASGLQPSDAQALLQACWSVLPGALAQRPAAG